MADGKEKLKRRGIAPARLLKELTNYVEANELDKASPIEDLFETIEQQIVYEAMNRGR